LAGRVLLKIVYLLVCRILGLAVLTVRKDLAKDAELLVLRHENAVLRRHADRVRYGPAGRVWFAALARLIPRRRWTEIFPVTPATPPPWHRRLATSKYDMSNSRKPGRPPTVPGIARLAVRLAMDNPLWGYRRIHGELTKLRIAVAPSTVWGSWLPRASIQRRAVRPDLAAVPARPSRRDPRGRLPARGHRAPEKTVRSGIH
jgi:putative transposase